MIAEGIGKVTGKGVWLPVHGHGLFIKTRVTKKFTPFPRRYADLFRAPLMLCSLLRLKQTLHSKSKKLEPPVTVTVTVTVTGIKYLFKPCMFCTCTGFSSWKLMSVWTVDSRRARIPDPGFRIPDSGFRIPDPGSLPDPGPRLPNLGSRITEPGSRISDPGATNRLGC
jgi:hypothetical protein